MIDFFDRYADRIEITKDGCWEWSGSRSTAGYGTLTISKQSVYAVRSRRNWRHVE